MLRSLALLLLAAAIGRADWITPKGAHYHRKPNCIGLRTTPNPKQISPEAAKALGLTPCGICYRTKKGSK